MVLDYSERRPVSKNRPKKQPVGILIFILAGAVLVSFGTGFVVGWFFCNQSIRISNNKKAAAVDATKPGNASPLQPPSGQPVPPLTFYQTLPSGATVMGSGLNPNKRENESKKTPVVDQQNRQGQLVPSSAPTPQTPSANEPKQVVVAPAGAVSSKKQSAADSGFCVQVTSLRSKKDADAIKSGLLAQGLAAYIVESTVQEKGTWYRVRLGKHLTHSEAVELAAKTGKGAIVTPE